MTDPASAIKVFCQCSRDIAALSQEALRQGRALQEQKRAAQAVLTEVLTSGGQDGRPSEEKLKGYIVSCNGDTYRVRPREVPPPAQRPTSSNLTAIKQIWEDPERVKDALQSLSGLEPTMALVSFLVDAMAAKQATAAASTTKKWKIEVVPYRPKGDADDGAPPPAAPAGTNIDELVETLLRARETHQVLRNECKEAKRAAEQKREEAAELVIPQLRSLPTEKKVQKINLKDSEGNTEAFYLRLKPPLKPKLRRVSAKEYRVLLRAAADDTIKRFCLDSFQLAERASTPEFGEVFCATLKELLASKESAVGSAQETGGEQKQRIALDRVRGPSRGHAPEA